MSQSSTGAGKNMASHLVGEIIAGGVKFHLLGGGQTVSYSDGAAEITSKSNTSVSVAEADMTVATPADISGVTTLTVDVELDFGSVDAGMIDDAVIQNQNNTDRWVEADVDGNPDTTGETVTISSNTTIYELGNPT